MVGQAAASDATQEAFLSAWSAIRGGAEVRLLRPWLFTIAHRKALGLLRERRRAPAEFLEDSLSNGVSSADQAQRTAQARETLAVLAALPEAQREALLGVAVHGRSGRQVARQLGVSESTARQLVFRARASLRAGAAVCVGPPLLVLRFMRRLLDTARRMGGSARAGSGWEQVVTTAKVAAVGVLGAAAVGAGTLHLGGSAPHRSAPSGAGRAAQIPAAVTASSKPTVTPLSGAAASSPLRSERTQPLEPKSTGGSRRSPLAPERLAHDTGGGSLLSGGNRPGAGGGSSSTAPAVATTVTAAGSRAGAKVSASASGLLGATSATTTGAQALGSQIVTLGTAGAGAVGPTVAATVGTVRKVVGHTISSAGKTGVAATRALGVGGARSGGQTQQPDAGAATSPAPSAGSDLGQAAGDTVQSVASGASTALASTTGAATSTVTQTVGAVTSTAAADTSQVAVGATGAVSTLVKQLTGG
jgi:RNA polymerase sigma factor (sigma-70 family)